MSTTLTASERAERLDDLEDAHTFGEISLEEFLSEKARLEIDTLEDSFAEAPPPPKPPPTETELRIEKIREGIVATQREVDAYLTDLRRRMAGWQTEDAKANAEEL